MPSPLKSPDTGLLLLQSKEPELTQLCFGAAKPVPLLVYVNTVVTYFPSAALPEL
ncbi:hypothetical protein Sgri01_06321 [Streptomyces griseus]